MSPAYFIVFRKSLFGTPRCFLSTQSLKIGRNRDMECSCIFNWNYKIKAKNNQVNKLKRAEEKGMNVIMWYKFWVSICWRKGELSLFVTTWKDITVRGISHPLDSFKKILTYLKVVHVNLIKGWCFLY